MTGNIVDSMGHGRQPQARSTTRNVTDNMGHGRRHVGMADDMVHGQRHVGHGRRHGAWPMTTETVGKKKDGREEERRSGTDGVLTWYRDLYGLEWSASCFFTRPETGRSTGRDPLDDDSPCYSSTSTDDDAFPASVSA